MDNLLNCLDQYSNIVKINDKLIYKNTCCDDFMNHCVSEEKNLCK